MKQIPNHLFKKIEALSVEVKNTLLRKGIVIPISNDDGSIGVGHYKIVKSQGFYSIVDYRNEVIVDKINLPQTAIVLANNLALGRFLDHRLINNDRSYGFAAFEELVAQRAAKRKRSQDQYEVIETKGLIAAAKKSKFKNAINRDFEKLLKLI